MLNNSVIVKAARFRCPRLGKTEEAALTHLMKYRNYSALTYISKLFEDYERFIR